MISSRITLPPPKGRTLPLAFKRRTRALLLLTLSASFPERFWIVVHVLSHRFFIPCICILRFDAEQTISSRLFLRAGGSWRFTVRSGLHALVVTPAIHSCMDRLGIGISAFTEF